ncbi:MAG: energy transducer TonB, partial [Bacteroidales bacterium]|nr:energy transducer TonB [Bacteroidales bacterium]
MKFFGKNILLIFGFSLYSFFGFSQNDKNANNDTILVIAQQMPEFSGGVIGLKRFIAQNLDYPLEAKEAGIQGRIFLRFEVTKTGDIGKIEIQKGIHPILDREAVRVIKSLPKFKPGMQNGNPVSVWYSMPISFRLNIIGEVHNNVPPKFPGGPEALTDYIYAHFI